MALLESQLDDFKNELDETPWSKAMDDILEIVKSKRREAETEARKPIYETLTNLFDLPTAEIEDLIKTCLKDGGSPGYTLLKHLSHLLENTPK